MTVVRAFVAGNNYTDAEFKERIGALPPSLIEPLVQNCAINSNPHTNYHFSPASPYPVQNGNKTECACLQYADTINPTP